MFNSVISDQDLAQLPDDPSLAFVLIESKYREALESQIAPTTTDIHPADEPYECRLAYLHYFNGVLSSAKALGINNFKDWSNPSDEDEQSYQEQYFDFRTEVDAFLIQVRILTARQTRKYSVAFDQSTKTKIRHHLTQVRSIVDDLDIEARKKESLFAKIAALELEVDKDRTRFDTLAALILDTTTVAAEVTEKLRPAVDLVTSLFGFAKKDEEATLSLPPMKELKRLEPPKTSPPAKKSSAKRPNKKA